MTLGELGGLGVCRCSGGRFDPACSGKLRVVRLRTGQLRKSGALAACAAVDAGC